MNKELIEKVTEMMKPNPVYLVGGAVRNYLLGVTPSDYDFCTPAEPDEIEGLIKKSGRRAYLIGKRFGTLSCKIEVDGIFHMVEITTLRSESYEPGNRKPKVEYVKSLHEDLSRRDFTINAICCRLTKGHIRIIDPFNGAEDLENGILRCVGNARARFKEDPLRLLRAIRFSVKFDLEIEDLTYKRMQSGAISILNISKERWMSELDKILLLDNVERGLRLLWSSNLFKFMIPELDLMRDYDQNSEYHDFNLDEHTIQVVKATPKDINLRWAALLHDISKPTVRTDKIVIMKDDKTGIDLNAVSREPLMKSNYIGHEVLGEEIVKKLALYLKWSNERTKSVADLVKNHLKEDSPLKEYDNKGKKNADTSTRAKLEGKDGI